MIVLSCMCQSRFNGNVIKRFQADYRKMRIFSSVVYRLPFIVWSFL